MEGGRPELVNKFALILSTNAIGATSYVFRWPERWLPGRFDFIGNGHQILHAMIGIEYYLQLRILLLLAEQRLQIATVPQ